MRKLAMVCVVLFLIAVVTSCGGKKVEPTAPTVDQVKEPTQEETTALTESEKGLIADDDEVDVGEMI